MIVYPARFRFVKEACDRLTEDSNFGKKIIFSQAKLSHLGDRKPSRIHSKADAPTASHCLARILLQQGEAITVNGDRYRAMLNEFLFTKRN